MIIKHTFLIYIISFLVIPISISQSRIENQLLVQFEENVTPKNTIKSLRRNFGLTGNIDVNQISDIPLNIWKFEFKNNNSTIDEIFDFVKLQNHIEKIQFNHKIKLRNTPNDPKFSSQWSMLNTGQTGGTSNADIDADLAWDLTTGGLTRNGDTIVICVIDNGIDTNHEDLKNNLWVNYNEIPDNGIDDDNNGYVDDYQGWNTLFNNDDISGGSHGTPVAGIIGAKGNNSVGIAGINWNVKLMILYNGDEEAQVVAAYSYVYKMRKLYNETNGEQGAYIVSTNSSFGVDLGKPENFPIWCSLYDMLGSVGIISIGATTNGNTNVDIYGDIPSTCPSEYLITVTNVNKYNNKENSAGYGVINVDLGAYGENTFTTRNNNGYGSFGGTSGATPHVTGVTGLIYSYNQKLADISTSHPHQSALIAKDAILNSTIENASLAGKTVTYGVVNAFNALNEVSKYDDSCTSPPAKIFIDSIGSDLVNISWEDYDPNSEYNIQYKFENEEWVTIENINNPYSIKNLTDCSELYFKLQKKCNDSLGEFGYEFYTKTIGCCDIPDILSSSIENDTIHLEWEDVFAANQYEIKYKYWSEPLWSTANTENPYIDLDYNYDCGKYIYSVQSNCKNTISGESQIRFLGADCDNCLQVNYCYPNMNNDFEFIDSFSISKFDFKNGKNTSGHGNFNHTPTVKLLKNTTYDFIANLVFSGQIYNDNFYIWIDLNKDGEFSSTELLVSEKNNNSEVVDGTLTIPDTIMVGETTMRIMLSAYDIQNPCNISSNDFGEYEDYCVYLDTTSSCSVDDMVIDSMYIDTSSIQLSWNNPNNHQNFKISLRELEDNGTFEDIVFTSDTFYKIQNLKKCNNYELILESYCSPIDSKTLDVFKFKTRCSSGLFELGNDNYKIYPNPFSDILNISSTEDKKLSKVSIYDVYGKLIYNNDLMIGNGIKLDLEGVIGNGIYFLKIEQQDLSSIYKITKI